MSRIACSCGGENERCYKCDGRGWYEDQDPDRPLKLSMAPLPTRTQPKSKSKVSPSLKKPSEATKPKNPSAVRVSAPSTGSKSKRRRIVLDNPPPPPLVPRERLPKRNRPSVPPDARTRGKDEVKHVVLIYKDTEFACTYDPISLQGAEDIGLAGEFLTRLCLLEHGRFLEKNTLRKLSILSASNADLYVQDRTGVVVKYALALKGVPRRIGVVRSGVSLVQTKPRGRETRPGRSPLSRESATPMQSPAEAGLRATPRPVGQSERTLDATRDYWQIRNHGQFGSHPSHDEFDE